MNRKSKIIVSVVGISIVLLALLGITYAYYLTRIEGNTNTNSISVTTADLKLKYGDGNGLISKSDIMPGTIITKTFTVSNEGESKVENYVVVLEQIVNTLSRTTDLKYTLTCELSNGNSCGSTEELIFPSGVTEKAIFLNSIDKEVTHNYTLTVNYINLTDTDQSTDMGSSISALVNIKDSKEIDTTGLTNPSEAKILANEIINNAKANKNGTIYSPTPLTTPAVDISGEEERTLSVTQDNMGSGTSYYFRGSVQDNYVLFNNMCFRIVRIEGDGSVKLIYAGDVSIGATNCNEVGIDTGLLKDENGDMLHTVYGYDLNHYADYENNLGGKSDGKVGLKEAIETWYISKFNTEALQGKIKNDKWCLGGNDNYKYDSYGNLFTEATLEEYYDENGYYEWNYAAGNRLLNTKTTSLMCENEDYVESKYGTLTSDEVMLAGGLKEYNQFYYLFENVSLIDYYWLILSRAVFDNNGDMVFYMIDDGYIDYINVDGDYPGVRPSITLVTGTTITGGEGIKGNPYIIE